MHSTALESSSRGCATIISNRGGLPETTDNSIILKKLNSNELYKEIKKLILNKKYRIKLQNEGFNNIKHLTKENSLIIDAIRESLVNKFKLNFINALLARKGNWMFFAAKLPRHICQKSFTYLFFHNSFVT